MSEWREIPSFPGYLVSDDGRVWGKRGQLSVFVDKSGYYRLGLYRGTNRINCRVHILVADAFMGARPAGKVIRHIDGNHKNNSVANLAWGTQSENVRDSVEHGTQRNARKTHCIRGHEFNDANTRHENGQRKCRACRAMKERERRARMRGMNK